MVCVWSGGLKTKVLKKSVRSFLLGGTKVNQKLFMGGVVNFSGTTQ